MILAFVGAARAAGLGVGAGAIAAWLALASASFATHGLEFRDGAGDPDLLLVAYGLIAKGKLRPGRLVWWSGSCATRTHLKGAYFALGVVALVLFLSRRPGHDARRLAGGAALAIAAWTAL